MKTRSNANRAIKLAAAVITAIVLGTPSSGQTGPVSGTNDEIGASLSRLETWMNSVELAVRYSAPSAEYDEIQSALNRLDFLASQTENQIRYKVPVEGEVRLIEYAADVKFPVTESTPVIALKRGTPRPATRESKN